MNIDKIVKTIKNYDYSAIDIDEFLDNRETDEFESGWFDINDQIDRNAIPENVKKRSDEIRKEVFLFIDNVLGTSELSEYISDDIELLIFADYLGISDPWFEKFVEIYENGELPSGIL